MENKIYEDEVELKKCLNEFGIRFGEGYSDQFFCAIFYDSVSGSPLSMPTMARSPLVFARDFPQISQSSKLNVQDIKCKLLFTARYNPDMADSFEDFIQLNVWISPYLYYKKEEEQKEEEQKVETK